jgi:hypothetical protein
MADLAFEFGIPDGEVAREKRRFVLHRILEPRKLILNAVLTVLQVIITFCLLVHFFGRFMPNLIISIAISFTGTALVKRLVSTYFDGVVEKQLDAEFGPV